MSKDKHNVNLPDKVPDDHKRKPENDDDDGADDAVPNEED